MTFSVQAGCFRPHVLLRLILALNHTQYKISWMFSYKRRSKESFDHTHPCTLRFHIYRLTTVRQRTRMNIKYRSRAAQLENDETTKRIFLHPSECHIRRTLCENFRESCLDDFHDTVRKHGFILSVVWPLLYVRSCWCFRVLQFLVTLTMGRNKMALAGHPWPCETCLLNSLFALEKTKRIKKKTRKILPWTVG